MKTIVVFCIAVLLAVPSVTFAGSATSRWDMTLGGFVKFDLMYGTKSVSTDNRYSPRDSIGYYDQAYDETGNLSWAGGETRLNWAVKGPDAWNAKTSALVEGEFRGRQGGTEYGLFTLRHAYMQLAWPKTQLTIGQTWQAWGMIPSQQSILSVSEEHFNRGYTRTPQIRLTQKITPEFTGVFALQAPYATSNKTTSSNKSGPQDLNQSSNGLWPDVVLDFSYASNALGKIRNFGLKVGIGGFYGKDKFLYDNDATADVHFTDEKVDRYGAGVYWYVPIIPEKNGNKAGALGFTGQLFAGKGMGIYLPNYVSAANTGAYIRPSDTVISVAKVNGGLSGAHLDIQYYMTNGGWIQGTYYFTDKVFMNALYGAQFNRVSKAFVNAQSTSTNDIRRIQNAIVNVMYDVNPAIRFGLEYTWVNTVYAARSTATVDNKGSFSTVRVGAYYFF